MIIGSAELHCGDCREVLPTLEPVDSIVTDPPYELGFMGRGWDQSGVAYNVALWRAAFDALKPGGHLLAFGGARTYHRMVCAIEDAGFDIRDQIMWVYGSGFPKSLDVSKAIDKAAGAERERLIVPMKNGNAATRSAAATDMQSGFRDLSEPATEVARQWQGWGTALKPAHEPIVVARKPLIGTVAANLLAHGTGALNIDACRVAHDEECKPMAAQAGGNTVYGQSGRYESTTDLKANGRWPANLIHDGSDEVLARFPYTESGSAGANPKDVSVKTEGWGNIGTNGHGRLIGDSGSAARFFYTAKASREDRDDGCEGLDKMPLLWSSGTQNPGTFQSANTDRSARNAHPTVKPLDLMRYLVRLVTPKGGVVLDPFMGSGSTGRAAILENFRFIGIEQDAKYFDTATQRIRRMTSGGPLFEQGNA